MMRGKKTIKGVIVIVFVVLAIAAVVLIFNRATALNHDGLAPVMKVDTYGEKEETDFSFAERAVISKGKYGFRKTLVFDKPVTISQEIIATAKLYDSPIYYGIYRDSGLKDPVAEVDVSASLHAEAAIEEGADVADYPEYVPVLRLNLEPGKYYAAIYTTEFFNMDHFKFCTSAEEEFVPPNDVKTKEIISKISTDTKDCELLEPFDADECGAYDRVTLDFRKKTVISEGKYGFRKKLNLKKQALFRQYSYGDWNYMRYGVYRDSELTDPVEEVNTTYNNRAYGAMEEGADLRDYPDYKDGIIILLEPGTYYIGIITFDPRATYPIDYVSELLPINEKEKLVKGKKSGFQIIPGDPIVYRRVDADKTGKIRVRTDSIGDILQLCDSAKKPISKEKRSEKDKNCNVVFSVTEGETYYIKIISTRTEFNASDGIGSFYIWYDYIN